MLCGMTQCDSRAGGRAQVCSWHMEPVRCGDCYLTQHVFPSEDTAHLASKYPWQLSQIIYSFFTPKQCHGGSAFFFSSVGHTASCWQWFCGIWVGQTEQRGLCCTGNSASLSMWTLHVGVCSRTHRQVLMLWEPSRHRRIKGVAGLGPPVCQPAATPCELQSEIPIRSEPLVAAISNLYLRHRLFRALLLPELCPLCIESPLRVASN